MRRGTAQAGARSDQLRRIAGRRRATPRQRATAPLGARRPWLRSRIAGRAWVLAEIENGSRSSEGRDSGGWWNSIERSIGLLATMATLAVAAFTWVSITQVRDDQAITREGQITDRYNAAIENLGSDSPDVRLGGIYALVRIMQDSARDQPTITNVLSSYVRAHARKTNSSTVKPTTSPSTDVAAALRAVCLRDTADDTPFDPLPDLHGADLSGADLDGVDRGAVYAQLTRAKLSSTAWRGARLMFAAFDFADMEHADLSRAYLFTADFTGTNLRDAHLEHADLAFASFSMADMRSAHLRGANMTNARLQSDSAFGVAADLRGADLRGADLTDSDVSVQQILSARIDDSTKLPAPVARNPAVKARAVSGHGE